MKKILTLTFSENEVDDLCGAIDFCIIHFLGFPESKKLNKIRKKIDELIPDSWGWVED